MATRLTHHELRLRGRAILKGSECVSPASVHDALSARVASLVGFELGLLSGSIATAATLPGPDLGVVTLTEFADQVRRVVRAGNLTLLVDADNGYGNALNVMRTIEETEHAGVSLIAIEDVVLPARFGGDPNEVVSTPEMTGKLRAALAARSDPALVIAARTAAARTEGVEGTVARAKAYAATGIDALFVVGFKDIALIEAVHAAVDLPLIIGSGAAPADRKRLQALGVRIMLQGHQPIAAAVKALRDTYEHLYKGGSPADLKSRIASAEEMDGVTQREEYAERQRDYLG
ncbi:MAG TPA: isocitrate lyase/phosphoenolpyruvate mutase family protein [Burkholderiales bacterium]|nr:isocitrate lyase/phosphoenolpyruvate mutase family protein [Burkholderiales bacterium]